jgi:hypothetical protein
MLLDEEAQRTEEGIRSARKIRDVPALKEILHGALAGFEDSLKALSPQDREAALSLYLDKLRRITFGFHAAVLKRMAKTEFESNPSREAMQDIIKDYDRKMGRIARLYRFL